MAGDGRNTEGEEAMTRPATRLIEIPSGFAGTAVVCAYMRRFARAGLEDERVNRLARKVTAGLPDRDGRAECQAILGYLQTTFRRTRLPWHRAGWQRLQTVPETLFNAPVKTGECASLVTAFAALAMSLGNEARFRTVGQDRSAPYDHEHVLALVSLEDQWIAADPSYDGALGAPDPRIAVWSDWLV